MQAYALGPRTHAQSAYNIVMPGYSGPLSAFNLRMREHLHFYAGKRQSNVQIWWSVLRMCKTIFKTSWTTDLKNPGILPQFFSNIAHLFQAYKH